jgi:hypothetical protein
VALELISFSSFFISATRECEPFDNRTFKRKKCLPRSVTPREKLISFSLSNGAASRQRKSSLAGTKGPSLRRKAALELISFSSFLLVLPGSANRLIPGLSNEKRAFLAA